jgi:hypothetical protein
VDQEDQQVQRDPKDLQDKPELLVTLVIEDKLVPRGLPDSKVLLEQQALLEVQV